MDQRIPTDADSVNERLAAAVRSHQRRLRERAAGLLEERYRAGLAEIGRLVARFREIDPNLGRVVFFGSMSRGIPRNPDFDIDLSFEGVEYYRCVAAALDSPFRVDLVDYKAAAPHIREAIDTEGRVVYAPNS